MLPVPLRQSTCQQNGTLWTHAPRTPWRLVWPIGLHSVSGRPMHAGSYSASGVFRIVRHAFGPDHARLGPAPDSVRAETRPDPPTPSYCISLYAISYLPTVLIATGTKFLC